MADNYTISNARRSFEITLSGATTLDHITTAGILVATEGNYELLLENDLNEGVTTYTSTYLLAGIIYPLSVAKMHQTGSAATTGIVGFYR